MFKFFVDTSGAVINLGTHTEQINIIQMRTKALLLAAAAVAAVASSQAQVYSVNAVGYVNKTLVPGFNMISNPLTAADNTIGVLFNNFQGGVRNGTTVYRFANGNFTTATYLDFIGAWDGDAVNQTTLPGEGVFVFLPAPGAGEAANKVLTFVGEVPQNATSTPIPKGFSIKSNVVPQAVAPDDTKNTDGTPAAIPAVNGNTLYRYLPAQKNYDTYSYLDFIGGWDRELPTIDVGESFYYFHAGDATTWNRTFSVNNPQ
jgi:hypothetical protein